MEKEDRDAGGGFRRFSISGAASKGASRTRDDGNLYILDRNVEQKNEEDTRVTGRVIEILARSEAVLRNIIIQI